MTHDNRFDVRDIISSCFNGVGELHVFSVDGSGEEVSKRSTPANINILSTSSLEQYQA